MFASGPLTALDTMTAIGRAPAIHPLIMDMAVREFDMYGDRPELASLINRVQKLVEAKLAV